MQRQLKELDSRLGAWYYDGSLSDEKDVEDRAKTFLCWMENVFGRFYEWKTRICDYSPIPDNYRDDWNQFLDGVCLAIEKSEPFNAICPVLHLRFHMDGRAQCIIDDIGIRPCAIEKSFFRKVLTTIARKLIDPAEGDTSASLVVKIFGIRRVFAQKVINETHLAVDETNEPANFTVMMRRPDTSSEHSLNTTVFTFTGANLESLADHPGMKNWKAPAAHVLNDFTRINENRTDLIRAMLAEAPDRLSTYLTNAKNVTHMLPPPLELDENDLMVYKYGAVIKFLPDEAR